MRFANAIRLLAIFALLVGGLALSGTASAQVAVEFSVGFAPPELPVYEQPICPGEGYIWTPGYWAWDDDDQDYYWVPGTWVLAPQVGYLWTPGYWGWGGEAYVFHVGYWGPVVGFYGGVDYGWGYTGHGYYGGRWDHDHFYYNREVNHIDERVVRNVYNVHVQNNVNITRVSYNGGNGGVNVRATAQEEAAARERHIGPVGAQNEHVQAARGNRELRASQNHGKPPIAATARPAAFSGGGVVAAKAGGNYNPPANRDANANRGGNATNRPTNESRPVNENSRPADNRANNNPNRAPSANNRPESNANRPTYGHSTELPKHSAPQAEANSNQKYQQQQEKLAGKQNQEHAKLQQRQEQEHQRATQQKAPPARQQQMEQRHQQQTQQMEQKHEQQQQKVQQRAAPTQQAPPRQQSPEKKPPH
jgi:YXWGXW repeat-containing protein